MNNYWQCPFSFRYRKYFFIFLLTFLPGLSHAEKKVVEKTSDDVSETFGRLFTTAKQRKLLDRVGTSPTDQQVNLTPETGERTVLAAPRAQLSGVVLRSDGKHMVWINGRSELSEGAPDIVARPGKPRHGSIGVPIHGNNGTVILKPGQVWLLDERKIEESYQVSTDHQLTSDKAPTDSPEPADQSEPEDDAQ